MSLMWERLLTETKADLALLEKQRSGYWSALQAARDRALSPTSLLEASSALEALEASIGEARDRLGAIEQQNAAQDKEEARRALGPLQSTSVRQGFYRDGKSRTEAILGILERERRRIAPLTREGFARAQSIDARSFDYKVSYGSPFTPSYHEYMYDPETGEVVAGQPYAKFDPCVEWRTQEKMRRAVMFAQGSAGRGHRGSGRRRLKPPGC